MISQEQTTDSSPEENPPATSLLKGETTLIVVEKYAASRKVLLLSTLTFEEDISADCTSQVDTFTICYIPYAPNFPIYVGAEIHIIKDCNILSDETAKISSASHNYVVGAGFLIKREDKFLFMKNKGSIGKINFMYSIEEMIRAKREMDEELKTEFQLYVKQFTADELECLKLAIFNSDDKSISDFELKKKKNGENVKQFFRNNNEFLSTLDLSQYLQDVHECNFQNYSPPKGKLESYASLKSKLGKTGKRHDVVAKSFPKEKFTSVTELLLWSAIFECLEETNALPKEIYESLAKNNLNFNSFMTLKCPTISFESRIQPHKANLQYVYFLIEEPSDSKFRLNTDYVHQKKKESEDYECQSYWLESTDENIPKSLREELSKSAGFQTVKKKTTNGRSNNKRYYGNNRNK